MLKKLISYLIIVSIFFVDVAFSMHRGSWSNFEDKESSPHKRSLSLDDATLNTSRTVFAGEGQYKTGIKNENDKIVRCAWRAIIPRTNLF